jgi:hypothetical protein
VEAVAMHLKKQNGNVMIDLYVFLGIAIGFLVFILVIDKMG